VSGVDAEIALERLGIAREVDGAAFERDPAFSSTYARSATAKAVLRVLLPEQDGDALRLEGADRVDDRRDDGSARGPPSARRARELVAAHEARAIASICCSPPERLPAS